MANGQRFWDDALARLGRFTPISDIVGRTDTDAGRVFVANQPGMLLSIEVRSVGRVWGAGTLGLSVEIQIWGKSKVTERLEHLSTGATIPTLKYAEIIALVMDPAQVSEKNVIFKLPI